MGTIFATAFNALWQVVLVGIVLGAGLPALFALGMKSISANRQLAGDGVNYSSAPTGAGRAGAALCFGLCVLAVLFGIAVIVFGKQILGK